MLRVLFIVTLICAQVITEDVQPNISRHLDTEERIAKDGYYSETHVVTTSDGYILEINRIPYNRNENKDSAKKSKPVVFLMHGLQGSAFSYFTSGPEDSVAYNLADSGYDVWMGNARGVINSRNHVTLNPDKSADVKQFFDFTFEDIATKDLPAMIDYILEYAGKSQLHYIGHSQGGTSFLVLNSMLPEYNQKIASAHLLAGVGYQKHFPNRLVSLAAISTQSIYTVAVRLGLIEILGPEWNKLDIDCSANENEICGIFNIGNIMIGIMEEYEVLAGASIKQYAHYGQNINHKSFRRWYYSPIANLLHYGSLSPPAYDLSKITINVTMHYTVGDELLDERDVLAMAQDMPNCKVRRVARDSFSHTDFVMASDAKELVTDYIIEELNKYDI